MQQRFKQRSFTPEDFAYITDDDHLCAFAISGTAGVGTSSLLKGLKERLPRLRHTLSAGDTMRKLQKQFGFATIGKFAQYLTAHPNLGFDEYVDDQIQLTAMHDNSAVEGRIAYLFAPLAKKILVIIYGSEYWNKIINFQAFVDAGAVAPQDLEQFKIVDNPEEAFEFLRDGLTKYHLGDTPRKKGEVTPEIAKTRP